jgi:hypothetical protein
MSEHYQQFTWTFLQLVYNNRTKFEECQSRGARSWLHNIGTVHSKQAGKWLVQKHINFSKNVRTLLNNDMHTSNVSITNCKVWKKSA